MSKFHGLGSLKRRKFMTKIGPSNRTATNVPFLFVEFFKMISNILQYQLCQI